MRKNLVEMHENETKRAKKRDRSQSDRLTKVMSGQDRDKSASYSSSWPRFPLFLSSSTEAAICQNDFLHS